VKDVFGYILFALGALISCLNFYLSFLRYPLYRLLGREYRWESGLPLFGSLFLVVAVVLLRESPGFFWGGLALALLDTGGLHWFLAVIIWHGVFRRDRTDSG
jgi:hypothetical protein